MKVLLLNGSPHPEGNTAFALKQMVEIFTEFGHTFAFDLNLDD